MIDKIKEVLMIHRKINIGAEELENAVITPAYGAREMVELVPKYELPTHGMPARTAYNLVRDELILDGNSRLNLATFVTTWMEDEARRLMAETFDKNMIDKDEYLQTAEIELRCVNLLARKPIP